MTGIDTNARRITGSHLVCKARVGLRLYAVSCRGSWYRAATSPFIGIRSYCTGAVVILFVGVIQR